MLFTKSLRAKTLLSVLTPSALGLVAVAIIALYAYEWVARDVVQQRDTELARVSAARLSEGLSQYSQLLQVLAADKDIHSMDTLRLVEGLREAPAQLDVFDAGLVVYDSEGVAVWLRPLHPKRRLTEFPVPAQFVEVSETLQPVFSDIFKDDISGEDAIIVAVPIVDEKDQFLGVMAGIATIGRSGLGNTYAKALEFTTGENGYAYLVDGNGRVIYHPDRSELGSSYAQLPPVMRAAAGEIGAVLAEDEVGNTVISGFAPIPGTTWGLVTQEDWKDIVGPIRGYSNLLLGLLVLAGISSGALVFFSTGRVLGPVHELTKAAQCIAGGDFDYASPPETGDELEALGRQFNVMAKALKESYEDLERRVADRTKELAALNDIAAVVSSSLDLEEILNAALDKTLEVMGIEAGGIYLLGEADSVGEEGLLTVAAHKGMGPGFVKGIDNLKVGEGFSGHVVQTGEPLVVRDLLKDRRLTRSVVIESGFRAAAIVPLASREKVWGSLFVVTCEDRDFSEREVDLLTHIGDQIGVAIENARLFDGEQRRAEQFRVISEMGRRITSVLTTDDLLQEIVRLVKESFGYYLVGISLIEGDELIEKAGSGPPFENPEFQPPSIKVGGDAITGWVAATGEPLLVPDVSKEPRYLFVPDLAETQSELCVPLKTKEGVIGVLNVESDRVNAFDDSDIAVLQSVARQAAVAIENARLFDAEQHRAEQFRVLSEVGTRITSLLAIDELLNETVCLVKENFGYYLVGIGLVEGDELVVRAGAGPRWDDPHFEPPRIEVGVGISGWVAATGEALLAPDVRQDPRYLLLPDSTETRSELAVPLQTKGGVIGVLDIQSEQANAFDETDLRVLQSLANLTAIAIEEARLFSAEQRRAEQFRAISEVGRHMTSILAVDELLHEIVRSVTESLGYYHAAIGLVQGDEVVIKAGAGAHWDDPEFQPSRLTIGGKGITARVAETGEPLLVPDVSREPRYLLIPESPDIRSEVAVPLKTKSGIIGVLDVQSDALNAFDESDLTVLQSLANQAAIAIENARLYEQAQQAAAMEERSRLARDLHDAVTQTLFSASLIGEVVPTLWESDQDEGRQLLQELRQLTRGALAEMRTLLLELRPAALAEASLDELLRQLGEAVTGRSGLPVEVTVEGESDVPPDVHVALYRIAQEALNNVVKHADASEVAVNLRCLFEPHGEDGQQRQVVELEICDDGCGFDLGGVPPERLGLGIVRERAEAIGAELEIETEPGSGTKVEVVWRSEQ